MANESNPAKFQAERYIDMFHRIMTEGTISRPRGMEIREIEDLQLIVHPNFPFMTFRSRKYDVNYFKKEMLWKLGANRFDDSICQHARMWSTVRNDDGSFNSNYGQYWFGDQNGFGFVIHELMRDLDSRRAVIPMLNASHLGPHVRDTVCTECIGFRVREQNNVHRLNMSVHMRSSDVIFGLGTDIPTFAFLYRLVLGTLQHLITTHINPGTITITAMSSHIYERHYEMVERILGEGPDHYEHNEMPWTTGINALRLASSRGNKEVIKSAGGLGQWLLST